MCFRPWGEVGPDVCCTDIDMIEFKPQQHQGACSRHCLRAGTGSYVWHLSVDTYSSCTWIGLVQEDADMSRFAVSMDRPCTAAICCLQMQMVRC